MIETRFKDTEIGRIPEDWEVVHISDLAQNFTGLTYSPDNVREYGTLVLRSSNIQNGKLCYDDNVFVDMVIPERTKVQKDDILVCVRNGSARLIGKCAIIDEVKSETAFGAFMTILRSKNNINPYFVHYIWQSSPLQKQVQDNLGATINQITNKDIDNFVVSAPTKYEEQTRIASALTSIDNLISSLDKLIEKKKNIKQGTMQQLFTGKKRLKGFIEPWGIKSFKDSFIIVGNNCYSREELTTVGKVLNVHYGDVLVKFGAVIDVKKDQLPYIIGKSVASHPLKDGDIIMADTAEDETCGKVCEIIGINNLQAESGLHTIAIRPLDVYGERFLGYFMNSSAFHDLLLPLMQGTKVTSISKSALMDVSFAVPSSIEEQTAIASVLYSMDNEINALECKKTKYESIKQGMMKQLLTGKIRLI